MAPPAGLLCLGFAGGHLLQLAARAHVDWHGAGCAVAQALVPDVTGGQWLRVALDLRWMDTPRP